MPTEAIALETCSGNGSRTSAQPRGSALAQKRARALVYTSVQDLQSSLRHRRDAAVIATARDLCASHQEQHGGYATKLKILEHKLRQLNQEAKS